MFIYLSILSCPDVPSSCTKPSEGCQQADFRGGVLHTTNISRKDMELLLSCKSIYRIKN
ncbi:hypothetical protein BFO_1184 [Tannerella forsythia 92A2]|uniref:Uncharacterized protein n=1 Tax=Tannerella forsythia (strain ATCC 43037 / JCM 10827 / CCUG 21028 A / KCTC 5666 / FDC 338) TaxID=203275 RepID=G8UIJ5_TANFA|nr:hypothetical protein BFO_1184 [Tannerella forsythia 92A2]